MLEGHSASDICLACQRASGKFSIRHFGFTPQTLSVVVADPLVAKFHLDWIFSGMLIEEVKLAIVHRSRWGGPTTRRAIGNCTSLSLEMQKMGLPNHCEVRAANHAKHQTSSDKPLFLNGLHGNERNFQAQLRFLTLKPYERVIYAKTKRRAIGRCAAPSGLASLF